MVYLWRIRTIWYITVLVLLWSLAIFLFAILFAEEAGGTDQEIGSYEQQFVTAVYAPFTPQELSREWVKSIIITKARELSIDPAVPLRIAECESNFRVNAINDNPATGDYSVGVFQINLYGKLRDSRPSEEWLLDARNNINYAFDMYLRSGWRPWSCY